MTISWALLYDDGPGHPECPKCKAHDEWWDNFYGDPDDEEETKDAPPSCDEHPRAIAFIEFDKEGDV